MSNPFDSVCPQRPLKYHLFVGDTWGHLWVKLQACVCWCACMVALACVTIDGVIVLYFNSLSMFRAIHSFCMSYGMQVFHAYFPQKLNRAFDGCSVTDAWYLIINTLKMMWRRWRRARMQRLCYLEGDIGLLRPAPPDSWTVFIDVPSKNWTPFKNCEIGQ